MNGRLLAPLALILRLVRREIPQSIGQFGILIACIALGVGAIVAVVSLSRALDEGLQREGRVILGADAAFTLIQRPASAEERAALAREGGLSELVLSRAMARAGDESALVEIKAIDSAYPIAGRLDLAGQDGPETRPLAALLAPDAAGQYGIVVDPVLSGRLNLGVGGIVEIGAARFRIAALLASEPDKLSGGIGFGPRVLMSRAGLDQTGLVQPGSLTRFVYRLDLGAGAGEARLAAALAAIARAVPDAGWQVASRMRASPQLQRQVARFTEFLTLVGLTALLIGGVGVANAARAFAERQVPRIATLKSLGATRGFVFLSALAQVLAFALIGIAIGLVLGAALPWLAITLFGHLLPYPLVAGIYPSEMALGLAYGVATVILFSILPLARAKAVPASTLFRDAIGAERFRPDALDLVLLLTASVAFVALAIGSASDQRIATIYIIAALAAIAALRGIAWAAMRLARALPRPASPVLRLALANLHRPGSLTPPVILSLGLGLALLVALTLIDVNLSRQFRAALPGVAPSFFFIDIPARDSAQFESFLRARQPEARIETVPQLRGRIVALKGVPAAEIAAAERVSWVLDGDRGITYAARPPEGSTVIAGEWWPEDYRGPPLVSFARDIAEGLGLDVGDAVSVNVLGRRITARIANLREIRWQRLGINFVMVFSPNTFAGAPHTQLVTLAAPAGMLPAEEVALARAVARAFPAISSVRVRDALLAVDSIVSQLALAIRASSALALLSSILVLGGALAASARTRQREGVILKTLGATRAVLMRAMLVEYAALGAIAVVFGLICGAIAAGFVIGRIMNLEFTIAWVEVVSIAFASLLMTVVLGMAGTWRILGQKPASYLRHA
ncbi:ABC transporter permease [Rhabdaerophilum calidifontis]|uniref:ABC transporter permease n=1 Tax=Rhabdaerophilum calidifontis TaxID=2604328 RepID=UPI00123AE04B|nr:FtsX-like permease family protein [Rhabdaerophilum calidifontis]